MALATVVALHRGKRTPRLYARTKSGRVYCYNIAVFPLRAQAERFGQLIRAADCKIDTAHWTKVK